MNLGDNPNLSKNVEKDTLLKKWLVNYVGEDFKKELEEEQKLLLEDDKPREWDGSVTVEMIVDKVSKEFPEFLMVVAEENWIRGYHQALTDVREGEKIYKQDIEKKKDVDAG